jgi:hypothetical protein
MDIIYHIYFIQMLKQLCITKTKFKVHIRWNTHIPNMWRFIFKLSNLPSQIIDLHCEIFVKKKMSMELCAWNYEILDGLVNGAIVNGILEDYIKFVSKSSNLT